MAVLWIMSRRPRPIRKVNEGMVSVYGQFVKLLPSCKFAKCISRISHSWTATVEANNLLSSRINITMLTLTFILTLYHILPPQHLGLSPLMTWTISLPTRAIGNWCGCKNTTSLASINDRLHRGKPWPYRTFRRIQCIDLPSPKMNYSPSSIHKSSTDGTLAACTQLSWLKLVDLLQNLERNATLTGTVTYYPSL